MQVIQYYFGEIEQFQKISHELKRLSMEKIQDMEALYFQVNSESENISDDIESCMDDLSEIEEDFEEQYDFEDEQNVHRSLCYEGFLFQPMVQINA